MRGLFFSVGIHAAGVVGLLSLSPFTRGATAPAEPPRAPLLAPSIVRVHTDSLLPPPRGVRMAGGGGGMVPPRPDVPQTGPTAISEKPLGEQEPDVGIPGLPP